jgi:acyl-[acyl-carrier-protein]-phospholipid O-acyltransferase/long-chain-fatty-acid--[acyl-carrier-protein] ligase
LAVRRRRGGEKRRDGMHWETSKTLASRSYLGLVLSQFLAAFNDQAIHFVAIFYASDLLVRFAHVPKVDQKLVLAVVTACFIAPFFLFSPIAGILADKFSKRTTIVFWKAAEVGITALALLAFLMLHTIPWGWAAPETIGVISAVILIICVFAMGTHSAFFVPAKYGIMPEILHASVLSRGNGLLEGTSFISQILGTSFGGWLYTSVKSEIDFEGNLHPGHEWIIGLVLLVLAVLGVLLSLLVERIPAAAPGKRLTLNPFAPMAANFRELGRSRSLVLATIGIAFFTFMTLYMRQSLIFEGETRKELETMQARLKEFERRDRVRTVDRTARDRNEVEAGTQEQASGSLVGPLAGDSSTLSEPQQSELRIAVLVALIGLGVGIGCSLAGQVSGNRLELGLLPVCVFSLVILTLLLAMVVGREAATVVALIAIGIAAGLYIVPMYTLLQHRAPKESKGAMVATSNFLNVTGGLVAVIVFYFVTFALQVLFGLSITSAEAERSRPTLVAYIDQLGMAQRIPAMLFISASLITLIVLVLLCWQRPDFLLRALSWFRLPARRRLKAVNAEHLPATGAMIVATNCDNLEQWMHVVAVLDRFTRFVQHENAADDDALLANAARKLGVALEAGSEHDPDHLQLLKRGQATLNAGDLVAIQVVGESSLTPDAAILEALRTAAPAEILPVYCGEFPAQCPGEKPIPGRMSVVVGGRLPADASVADVRAALAKLKE